MSQTKEDVLEDGVEEVITETKPTTDTNATTTKVLRKRKAPIVLRQRTLDFRKRLKRNQTLHKKRVQKKEDKIKLQVRQDKIKKINNLNHESKKCCLLSPKRTYQAIYNEISYPKTTILPANEQEWENLKSVEDMYDEYGLISYIIKLHKQMTSVYFMVRDLEYRYHGYHL